MGKLSSSCSPSADIGVTENPFLQMLTQLTQQSGTYPRPDLKDLNRFLQTSSVIGSRASASDHAGEDDDIAVVHYDSANKSGVSFNSTPQGLIDFETFAEVQGSSALVFIRGFASANWLKAFANKYDLGTELFQRHLQSLAYPVGRDFYSYPVLPSASRQIFQLIIPTICLQGGTFPKDSEDLSFERQSIKESMLNYMKAVRKARVTDSVVRQHYLLSKRDYLLEQMISIEIKPTAQGCRTIVWMDHGRDLADSIKGPWVPAAQSSNWETYLIPILVKQRKSPGLSLDIKVGQQQQQQQQTDHNAPWKARQNICLLPLTYSIPERSWENSDQREEAFAMLDELFGFAVSAECQFLNLFTERIEQELSSIGHGPDDQGNQVSLLNLKHMKAHLLRHRRYLSDMVAVLQIFDSVTSTIDDFVHLLQSTQDLIRECETGMSTLASNSVLAESQRSYANAMRVQRLTYVATVYIPLSFICSVWGMNFAEFGQGTLSIWWFPVTFVPTLFITLLVLFRWDSMVKWLEGLGRCWR